MSAVVIRRKFSKGLSNEVIELVVTEDDISEISSRISADERALHALKIGYEERAAAMKRGDTSSPEIPAEYSVLFEKINEHQDGLAGSVGLEVINIIADRIYDGGEGNV